jgi:hypothetical protein
MYQVCMDRHSPCDYSHPTQANLEDSTALIAALANLQRKHSGGGVRCVRLLVGAALTPRFIPTCSLQLLKGLASLFSKHQHHHQQQSLQEEETTSSSGSSSSGPSLLSPPKKEAKSSNDGGDIRNDSGSGRDAGGGVKNDKNDKKRLVREKKDDDGEQQQQEDEEEDESLSLVDVLLQTHVAESFDEVRTIRQT